MPTYIPFPTIIEAAGNKPKIIREYVGRVNTGAEHLSIAHMQSPAGWVEPGQRPEFDEYTVVIHGQLHVTDEAGEVTLVSAGEAIITHKGEWIQYSTPGADGAEYIAVCIPAFAPETVHRDGE
jgi:ethanolamine utilization protein EutQ (cupin superfamily)